MANALVVVIATAGRAELLHRTLLSLSRCRKPDIFRGVLVVENGQKGDAEEICRSFALDLSLRYEYVERANKSNALNRALELVTDGIIFFTDDDVRLHPGTLLAYAKAAGGNTEGYYYGGPMEVDYEEEPPDWLKEYLPASARGWAAKDPKGATNGEERFFLGANWAAFASDLRAAGGFEPNYGPGSPTGSRGQESDMQGRLWNAGVRNVYVPEALVWHYVPQECCSPRWALARRYNQSMGESAIQKHEGPRLFGYPRWMFRSLLGRGLRLLTSLAARNPVARFDAVYRFVAHLGYMRGSRLVSNASKSK